MLEAIEASWRVGGQITGDDIEWLIDQVKMVEVFERELNNKIISEMETDELINQLQEENKKLNAIIKFADTKINHILGSGKGEKINMLV